MFAYRLLWVGVFSRDLLLHSSHSTATFVAKDLTSLSLLCSVHVDVTTLIASTVLSALRRNEFDHSDEILLWMPIVRGS